MNELMFQFYALETMEELLTGTRVFLFWEGDRTPHRVILQTKSCELPITNNPLLAILLLRIYEYADWLHGRLHDRA